MTVTLKDLYDAFNAGTGKATLLRLVEELERNHVRVPPDLLKEIIELADLSEEEEG